MNVLWEMVQISKVDQRVFSYQPAYDAQYSSWLREQLNDCV